MILHGHEHDPHLTDDGGLLLVNGGWSTKPRHGQRELRARLFEVDHGAITIDELSLRLV